MKALPALVFAAVALAAQAGAGDRLVKLARDGGSVDPGYVHRDLVALLAAMKVDAELRERFDRAGGWDVRRLSPGERLDSASDVIVIARGNAYIDSASRAIIIAANDVEIDDGGDVVVIAGGNVRFRQSRMQPWAGVFASRGGFEAPWLSHAAVAAGAPATLTHTSRDVLFYNTALPAGGALGWEMRSGPPLFDGVRWDASPPRRSPAAGDFLFAGEQCAPEMTLKDLAPIAEMARNKLQCGVIDDAIVTCDAKTRESLWTLHGCTNGFTEIIARRKGGQVEIVYAPPPSPRAAQATRVEPKPLAPGECPDSDASPRCILARIVAGREGMPATHSLSCPPPVDAASTHIDQLKTRWSQGVGGISSKAGTTEGASFFEVSGAIRIARIDWSGIVDRVDDPTPFLARIYRDADGVPGGLVKEWRLDARSRPASEVRFPPRFGSVHIFHATITPFDLPAGRYWISLLEPPMGNSRFVWSTERDAQAECGSGAAQRKGERDPWGPIWTELAPRSTRGYSFSLGTLPR